MKLLTHAAEVITGSGVRRKFGRQPKVDDMDRIPDGAMVYDEKRILWVGKTKDLPKRFAKLKAQSLKNKKIVTPGLVDCHTHLVHAGSRSEEFAARCAGESYESIAKRGGGIWSTVRATREATEAELFKLACERVEYARSTGVKVIESKSGYGLNIEGEIKQLNVNQLLKKKFNDMIFSSTFLGAHDFPKDQPRADYIRDICDVMLPLVAKKKLADCCDVFSDRGYYTPEETRYILSRAKELGLDIKVHADELQNTEATDLAVDLGAWSADHLLKVSEASVRRIAHSNTVAVLLPGTAFFLKTPYAPARRLIDDGARVAIATDFNPGSCNNFSLRFMMTLSALFMNMSAAEIFAAVTFNAAAALRLEKTIGTLEVGLKPLFSLFDAEKFEDIYYKMTV
ncbi:MAG: imidazolonepropionase [Xanthomonadaceae bacterium]|nr:imidazolonepropionase [Xanthomonadaceae bacterium]